MNTHDIHGCEMVHDHELAEKLALFDAEVCELLVCAKDYAQAQPMTSRYLDLRRRLCEQALKMFNPEQYKWKKENE